jgi:starvation-inducible DNA-binding protein
VITTIGISSQHRQRIAEKLSVLLADEFSLYVKTLSAHWNVEGPDFYSKHIFLNYNINSYLASLMISQNE